MNDLISRQAAIDAIDAILPGEPMKNEYTQGITCGAALAIEYVKQLPSAQPEPRWIPCSERYPQIEDEYKHFLVTDDKGKVSVQEFYISLDEEPQPYFSGMENTVAWMPLPEPYREERTEE